MEADDNLIDRVI